MPFVLDASVTLAWALDDEASPYAVSVLESLRQDQGLVPSLWQLEVANGLLVAGRRGRISPSQSAEAIDIFLSLPIAVVGVSPELAMRSVLELARTQGLTAYDAAYLDLAMRQGLPLATEDGDLRAAAARVGVSLLET